MHLAGAYNQWGTRVGHEYGVLFDPACTIVVYTEGAKLVFNPEGR
jgi:hypothetical protein